MRAGPKAAVNSSPLLFRSRLRDAGRFAAFCRHYVIVPKGKGALKRRGCGHGKWSWSAPRSTPTRPASRRVMVPRG